MSERLIERQIHGENGPGDHEGLLFTGEAEVEPDNWKEVTFLLIFPQVDVTSAQLAEAGRNFQAEALEQGILLDDDVQRFGVFLSESNGDRRVQLRRDFGYDANPAIVQQVFLDNGYTFS